MTPERWRRIVELFEQALARPEDEREAWLAERCAGDAALREEVERLLEADRGAGAFLGGPAGGGTAPPAPAPAAFGRYQVVERIGGGGFSEVFRGLDPVLGRPVAIKACRSASPEVRRRFAREAEIVARLDHPNVTTVYDFGVDGDVAYLVQELLGGEDLQRLLDRGAPPPFAARVAMLLEIARGLDYAHERGVVHRDVKPGNLRVDADGRVKIMDFGIAALLGDATRLTQAGTVLGTAAYMAPEQIRGEAAGPRTDVYSFGAVAYELLAGRPPYRADSLPALLYRLLHEEPEPLTTAAPECPPGLAALVGRCLARDPAGRPAGFGEVIAGLEAVAAGGDAPVAAGDAAGARPSGSRRPGRGGARGSSARGEPAVAGDEGTVRSVRSRRLRELAAAAALALAAAAAAGAWYVRTREAEPAPPAGPAAGLLAIDAGPWAEVAAIENSAGAEQPLPADPITPLAVAVPRGAYTVTLRDPRSGATRECTATVTGGASAVCRAEFGRIDAREFVAGVAPP